MKIQIEAINNGAPMKSAFDKETGYKEPSLQDAVDLLAKCSTIAKQWISAEETESDESLRRKARA